MLQSSFEPVQSLAMNNSVGRAFRSNAKAILCGSIAANFRLLLWLKDRFSSKGLYKLKHPEYFPNPSPVIL
jgi:hypothetical protein